MLRTRENLVRTALFHLVAAIHHQHPVGHFRHHAHIVRDEDHPHVHLFLQLTDQLQNLGLNRHVERRGRFIRNQQLRLARQRHRDHHPLPHPARQLVRIAVQNGPRLGNAHPLQHAQRFRTRRRRIQTLVQLQGLGNLVARREAGVQRRHRLLENHRHVRTAHALQRRVRRVRQVQHLAIAAAQEHVAIDDLAAAIFHQAHQRQRRHRLARARFAHDG
ncbi:hypothetical protein D3C72_956980 [compost metagenome]